MDRIIAGQETLRQLVDNRWLSILQIDTHGKVYERRAQGKWEAAKGLQMVPER